MARANINRPDGTKIVIDGSPDEIDRIMTLYGEYSKHGSQIDTSVGSKDKLGRKSEEKVLKKTKISKGPKLYLTEIIEEGFFSQKRSLSEIQKRLEEKGHIYPQEHLSTPILRLVRQKLLRRIRDKKGWCYVNP